jgi:hypothetical protein
VIESSLIGDGARAEWVDAGRADLKAALCIFGWWRRRAGQSTAQWAELLGIEAARLWSGVGTDLGSTLVTGWASLINLRFSFLQIFPLFGFSLCFSSSLSFIFLADLIMLCRCLGFEVWGCTVVMGCWHRHGHGMFGDSWLQKIGGVWVRWWWQQLGKGERPGDGCLGLMNLMAGLDAGRAKPRFWIEAVLNMLLCRFCEWVWLQWLIWNEGWIASEQLEMGYGCFEELKAWKGATG